MKKEYGEKPKVIGKMEVDTKEMMFIQYMPIKLEGKKYPSIPLHLRAFEHIVRAAVNDFIDTYGKDAYIENYIYVTIKCLHRPLNRDGWHSDGFMTDDINYVWCDQNPTVFNFSNFHLTQDDILSMKEMEQQAHPGNDFRYDNNVMLRMDQFVIHKQSEEPNQGVRNFVKVSFSKDKYDLEGNAHNHLLDYNWNMRPRREERNAPQNLENL